MKMIAVLMAGALSLSVFGEPYGARHSFVPFVAMGNAEPAGRFVAVASSTYTAELSDNDSGWYSLSSPTGVVISAVNGVSYGNGRFVAVGTSGSAIELADGLRQWTKLSKMPVNGRAITYGGNRFVGIADNGIYYMEDGQSSWTKMSGYNAGSTYNSIAYGKKVGGTVWNRFVVVGSSGVSYLCDDFTDVWESMPGLSNKTCRAVVYRPVLGGQFITVSDSGKTLISGGDEKGPRWDDFEAPITGTIYGMAYGNGRIVAVGNAGVSYSLRDSSGEWSQLTGLDSSKLYRSVSYGNGMFVAVGASGKSHYLLDGETQWRTFSGTGLYSSTFYGVAYGNQ